MKLAAAISTVFISFFAENIFSQEAHLSIQIEEYIRHRAAEVFSYETECPAPNSVQLSFKPRRDSSVGFFSSKIGKRLSYGFHPYWSKDTEIKNYRWDLLTHIGYFGADIDPLTGNIANTHNWKTTFIRDTAHKYGVKVELVTILFSRHDSLLLYPARRAKAIENLVKLVRDYKGDGINLDFEAVPKTSRSGFLAFVSELRAYVAADTNFSISLDLPAIDWSNIFDLPYLKQYVDVFFMMGYDYYWSTAPSAGPVAPLELGYYNLKRSVATHLANGLPPEQFILGLPWYGYDWPTKDSTAPGSKTLGTAHALIPTDAIGEAMMFGRFWNDPGKSAFYYYLLNDTIHQVWYDDEMSLAAKYKLANDNDLIGIGYWAIPYAAARRSFWDEIEKALQSPSRVAVSDREAFTIYPNPAIDKIMLAAERPDSYEIYNTLGQRVLTGQIEPARQPIDIRSLPSGRYYLRLAGINRLSAFLVSR